MRCPIHTVNLLVSERQGSKLTIARPAVGGGSIEENSTKLSIVLRPRSFHRLPWPAPLTKPPPINQLRSTTLTKVIFHRTSPDAVGATNRITPT